jgi:hypothetical protein
MLKMSKDESRMNDIPLGNYCYNVTDIVNDDTYGIRMKTKLCPYYVHLDEGKCKCLLMNVDSDDDFLIDEQVKICGCNEKLDEEV